MKKFLTMFLAVVMALTLSVSLAGCGKDNAAAKPPTDNGNVADESTVTLEGTYRADSASAVLGKEITFNGNRITTNAGDGTYTIVDGKLSIQYDNGYTAYAFRQSGDSIYLDDTEFVKVDESGVVEEASTSPVGDPTAEWYGLVLRFEGKDGTWVNIPGTAVVDKDLYTEYIRDAITYRDKYSWSSVGPDYPIEFDDLNDSQTEVSLRYVDMHFFDSLGAVFQYYGYVSFTKPDGNKVPAGSGEDVLYYSVTLDRVITYKEFYEGSRIPEGQWPKLYPEEYEKYVLGK